MATQAAIGRRAGAVLRAESNQVLWRRVKALQDAYRTALLNRLYYGHRLSTTKNRNLILEIVLAVGTSSVIGAWALWRSGTGELVWATVAGLSALLAVLKPILQFPREIERYSKLFTQHGLAFYDLEVLVGKVTRAQKFEPELEQAFRKTLERIRDLSSDDDPNPSRKLVMRCYNEVNEKIPVASLWRPTLEKGSSHV